MLQPNEIYLNGNNSTVQIASAHETSKTFSYNGNEVLFDIKDDVMVNATQLAKIYGKRPNDYLSLPATNQLINAITRKYGISENQLVISKAGSSHNGGGTWMHEDVALEFLSTLSAVRIIPLTGLVDKAFKKILFSFGSLRNCCTFAVLQVDRIIYLAEQAVKLLIFYMGIFYAHTLGYWRLPIRKLLCALRGRLSTCSSVYGNRFLFAYCLHK
jgi:hypothetical protein|nr:MAG TPA: KilA-N domain [Caudoviricetes sp.]